MPNPIEGVTDKVGTAVKVIETTAKLARGIVSAELIKSKSQLEAEIAGLTTEKAEREKAELEKSIEALRDEKENPVTYNNDDGLYYSADDTDKHHPYCPACYDADKKRIHLLPGLKCPKCNASYYQIKASDIRTARIRESYDLLKNYW
jgi:hypothetical protein